MRNEETFEEHITEVESWLAGDHDRLAHELLASRGIVITPEAELSDSRLRKSLNNLIDALAAEKIYLEHTDHLSDRVLYDKIVSELLPRSFAVGGDDWDLHDFAAVFDEETRQIYLAYYADEAERKQWGDDSEFELPVPPRRAKPYDRDRHLPREASLQIHHDHPQPQHPRENDR